MPTETTDRGRTIYGQPKPPQSIHTVSFATDITYNYPNNQPIAGQRSSNTDRRPRSINDIY
jgi:hypothetical protein